MSETPARPRRCGVHAGRASAAGLLVLLLAACAPQAPHRPSTALAPAPLVATVATQPLAVAAVGAVRDFERIAPGPRLAPAVAVAAPAPSIDAARDEPAPAALPWPRYEVSALAFKAFACADRERPFRRPRLAVIDYSLPASQPRLWVIDLAEGRVLHHTWVAHGEQSGGDLPVAFSNRVDSHQSSLGLFRTGESYFGTFGYAMRLAGLEPGFNDNAERRAIVMHGAPDVGDAFVAAWGTIGRTWGCPAVPDGLTVPIIDSIAGGSAVFAYYPDRQWLLNSRYLHCDGGVPTQLAARE